MMASVRNEAEALALAVSLNNQRRELDVMSNAPSVGARIARLKRGGRQKVR